MVAGDTHQMAQSGQLEKIVSQLIEQYTRSVQEALAGRALATSPAEEPSDSVLRQLNRQVERQLTAVTQDVQRAEAASQTRARQQAVVAELGQRALAGAELSELMDEVCQRVEATLDVPYCKILELLPDGAGLRLR